MAESKQQSFVRFQLHRTTNQLSQGVRFSQIGVRSKKLIVQRFHYPLTFFFFSDVLAGTLARQFPITLLIERLFTILRFAAVWNFSKYPVGHHLYLAEMKLLIPVYSQVGCLRIAVSFQAHQPIEQKPDAAQLSQPQRWPDPAEPLPGKVFQKIVDH